MRVKELKLSDVADVVDDPAPDDAVYSDALLPVEQQLPVILRQFPIPILDIRVAKKLSSVQDDLFSQFNSMFTDFAKQLRV